MGTPIYQAKEEKSPLGRHDLLVWKVHASGIIFVGRNC